MVDFSLKVLFILQEGPDSGITVYTKSLAEELRKRGVEVVIDEKYQDNYDIIHVHGRPHLTLLQKLLNRKKTILVTTTHMTTKELDGLIPKELMWVADSYLIGLHQLCTKIFVTVPAIMKNLKKSNSIKNKLILLGYGVNLKRFFKRKDVDGEVFRKKLRIDSKRKIVLCVASIQKRKGVFDFIETAKKLPQYEFVWVGKIPQTPYLEKRNELIKIVKENKIPNLHFPGVLFEDKLVEAFYSADLFWLPSYSETFGLVVVEAAASGKQVLLRNLPVYGAFKKFINIYEKNPEKKIIDILEEKTRPKNIKLLEKETQKFSIENHTTQVIKEYENLINNKKIIDDKRIEDKKDKQSEFNEGYYSRKNFFEVIRKGGYVKGFGGNKEYQWKADFVKKFYKKKTGKIIDIGCGEGHFLQAMPKTMKKYGLDISEYSVKKLREKGIDAKMADFEKEIPFNTKFDIITAFDALEHSSKVKKTIDLIKEKMSEDSIFVVEVPVKTNFERTLHLIGMSVLENDATHYQKYNFCEWEKMLKKEFEIVYGKKVFFEDKKIPGINLFGLFVLKKRKEQEKKNFNVLVSIIVPTLNEEKFIKKTLIALQNQTIKKENYEIIVSDSSSTDNTVIIAKKYADKVVVCKRKGAGHGRNFGAKQAVGKYLAFVDADTIVSKTYVEGLIESLEKGVASTGPMESLEKDSKKLNAFYKFWNTQTKVSIKLGQPIFPGFNFGVRKKEFEKLKGFKEKDIVVEDMDLSFRLVKLGKIVFNKKMSVSTSTRRLKEVPIYSYILNATRYVLTGKSWGWEKHRKDFKK